jgi:hypothetical protein
MIASQVLYYGLRLGARNYRGVSKKSVRLDNNYVLYQNKLLLIMDISLIIYIT